MPDFFAVCTLSGRLEPPLRHSCDMLGTPLPHSVKLKPQEIPFDHPDSKWQFNPLTKQLVATSAAIRLYQADIREAIDQLRILADKEGGLDYLQIFESDRPENLWLIEDEIAITALLPSDY